MGRPPLKLLEMDSHILYMLCTEMSSIVDVCMKLFETGIKKLKKVGNHHKIDKSYRMGNKILCILQKDSFRKFSS